MGSGLDKAVIALIIPALLTGPQFLVILLVTATLVGYELIAAMGLGIFGVD